MDPGTILAVSTAAVKVLSILFKYFSDAKDAVEDVKRLSDQVENIRGLFLEMEALSQGPDAAKLTASGKALAAISQSLSDIEELMEKLNPKTTHRAMKRMGVRALKWPFTKKQVDDYIKRLESDKISLIFALNLDSTVQISNINSNVTFIKRNQDVTEQERLLSKLELASADGAAFDSNYREHEPCCAAGTRVKLLQELQEWSMKPGSPIFWLNGMAGMGKSTIARTVAQTSSQAGQLRASFFFSRGTGDLGHAKKFVTTVAFQMAHSIPFMKEHICHAIGLNDNITRQGGLRNQWNELILGPLSRLAPHQNLRLMLVVDALDECEDEQDIKSILQLFAETKDLTTVDFKVFVTSRPETPIRTGFRDMPEIIHQDMALHDISRSVVEHEITVYLEQELLTIRRNRDLPSQWPGQEQIRLLVEKTNCIFIFIATACLFIRDLDWNPDEQLSVILRDDIMEDSPTAKLDSMYTQVLMQSVFKHRQGRQRARLSERFKKIVGSIIVLFDVLPAQELSALLLISKEEIDLALGSLHSVLNVPKNAADPIRLLHPSFRDFLLQGERCPDADIRIKADEVHENLAQSCLWLISKELKRDICGLKLLGTEVCDLQNSQIDPYLAKHVQYACHYWFAHLEKISHGRLAEMRLFQDDGPLHEFFKKDFLHWLEVLGLIKRMSEGVLMVTGLESLLDIIQHDQSSALYRIVYDAKRFIFSNRYIIEKAPLQVYASALTFCPQQSMIRNQYLDEFPKWIKRPLLVENHWSSTLQTLEGHSESLNSISFSPDGQQLASASFDSTVRLWDLKTGAALQTLEGDCRSLASDVVTFSPDGQQLASTSEDNTVRLWNPKTGASLQTMEGHSDCILSIRFTPDGQQLASASKDNTVRLWDPKTGASLQTLERHSHFVTSITFSPDGQQLASGSWDNTVRLWDPKKGASLQTLEGHSQHINSITFSPDGQQLASASDDKAVRLWDSKSGAALQTLEGHSDEVNSIAFSPDGQQLASASQDKTVRLWNSKTGASLQTLEGHSDLVMSIMFSPDGKQLASASGDKTVRLWDPKTGEVLQTLKGHSREIMSMTFSPDGQQLASASGDKTVRLWDLKAIAALQPRERHSSEIRSIRFSPDGQQLASASQDKTVRLWNPKTGASLQTLEGHSDSVASIRFSPDGKQLACGSIDGTVRLWDLKTGEALQTLEGLCDWENSMTFSPDGQQLASISYENTIRLWDTKTGASLQMLEGHSSFVISITFSPNGQQLVSASTDRTMRLWDIKTGANLQTLEGDFNILTVPLIIFSFDGLQLACTSSTQTLLLWDLQVGKCLKVFDIEEDITELSFSPEGLCIETNTGQIQFSSASGYVQRTTSPSNGWSIQQAWLKWKSFNTLRFPPDFQLDVLERHENLFAIADKFNRVIFLELPSEFDPFA